MISHNCTVIETVPIFLKALLDKQIPNIAKQGGSVGYNHVIFSAHVRLIGQMASQYKFNLVDATKDREPSVAKTVKRIVVGIIEMFFD